MNRFMLVAGCAMACGCPTASLVEPVQPSSSASSASSSGGGASSGGTSGGASSSSSGESASSGAMCLPDTLKPVPPPRPPVYYGTRQPTHVPLDNAQQNAVIAVATSPSDGSCSGTLIAPRVVLTARHCTRGTPGDAFYALFGPDDSSPLLAVPAVAKREHADLDLALLQLASDPTTQINVRPVPIGLETLSFADNGITLEQAGYGRTQTGYSDGRFFVAEVLDGFEDQGGYLVVNGMGQRGVCFGDSGGPSMRIAPAGDARVVGALGWGDDSCVGRDRYTRTDLARAWIEEWTGPTPGAGPQPCGSVTVEGRCNSTGSTASWCEGDILQNEVCADGEVCSWEAAVPGWRCVAAGADACGGATAFGACDGQVLTWCDEGIRRARNCSACGERCVKVDDVTGFACVPSDCGDLDYQGRCDGAVAEWCNRDGARETEDCGARGRSCGYLSPSLGYYCLPGACGDVDYRGHCVNSTAEWCENGDLRTRDCAAEGRVCGLVNDEVGYFCRDP